MSEEDGRPRWVKVYLAVDVYPSNDHARVEFDGYEGNAEHMLEQVMLMLEGAEYTWGEDDSVPLEMEKLQKWKLTVEGIGTDPVRMQLNQGTREEYNDPTITTPYLPKMEF